MTIRLSLAQASAYRELTEQWHTPRQLGCAEATLDALTRLGYAEKLSGNPPQYRRGKKEL